MSTIAENLAIVRRNIAAAAKRNGRDPADIILVAVSKTHPREIAEEALAAGQNVFGENRIQEAADKFSTPLPGAELHMIGHLQSNKTKVAAGLFDRIHSIDSLKTATRLDRHLEEAGRSMAALVQVNLGGEMQKSGIDAADILDFLRELAKLSRLKTDGLMILPPFFDDPEETRPYFQQLRRLRDELTKENLSDIELKHLSMGMTNDYAVAIEEGATIVRVGTAIFGQRKPYPPQG